MQKSAFSSFSSRRPRQLQAFADRGGRQKASGAQAPEVLLRPPGWRRVGVGVTLPLAGLLLHSYARRLRPAGMPAG
jgi:hypothetical protein